MSPIVTEILGAFWFFLPCGVANMMPVFAMFTPGLKKLNYPLDCYKTFKGIRIFGDHKSWRGLISGIIGGLITVALQAHFYNTSDFVKQISWLNYSNVNLILLGTLAGAGALLGDAIKSFFKRRTNLKPGAPWFPFDQIDYILGGIVFMLPIVQFEWWRYSLIIVLYVGLHVGATVLGYLVKLKDSPI